MSICAIDSEDLNKHGTIQVEWVTHYVSYSSQLPSSYQLMGVVHLVNNPLFDINVILSYDNTLFEVGIGLP